MSDLEVDVSGVGGIDDLSASFARGGTLIVGPNASNKTSLLRSIAFGLGCDAVTVKSDADRAAVRLELEGQAAERTATRTGTAVEFSGTGLLSDPEPFEYFACLLENNPLRTAVRQGEDIESALKTPIDIESLERERREALADRRDLRDRLAELEGVEERLNDRRNELAEARERAEELEEKLERLRRERPDADEDDELAALREERATAAAERDRYEERIGDLEDAIERFETRRSEVTDAIDEREAELEDVDVAELKRERERVRERVAEIDERIEILQSVMTANREMLSADLTGVLGRESGFDDDRVVCWACGDEAVPDDFEETLSALQEIVEADRRRKAEHEPEVESLRERIEAVEAGRRRLRELRSEHQSLGEKIEDRRGSLSVKREQLSSVEDRIRETEAEIERRRAERSSEASDADDEIERTHAELTAARSEVERLAAACRELEEDRDRREEIDEELAAVEERIRELTDRIENLEEHHREQFNAAMDDLLEILAFERIERIWLDGDFEPIIAREVDGRIRRDSVRHVAESEREVIGLVLGLAGYLAFDMAEYVPVVLIDSLGALDAERARTLVEYFAERAAFVLAAVHPSVAEGSDLATVEPSATAAP